MTPQEALAQIAALCEAGAEQRGYVPTEDLRAILAQLASTESAWDVTEALRVVTSEFVAAERKLREIAALCDESDKKPVIDRRGYKVLTDRWYLDLSEDIRAILAGVAPVPPQPSTSDRQARIDYLTTVLDTQRHMPMDQVRAHSKELAELKGGAPQPSTFPRDEVRGALFGVLLTPDSAPARASLDAVLDRLAALWEGRA